MTGRKNKCVRKNCNNQVFSVKMAVEKRLCMDLPLYFQTSVIT